MGNSLGGRIQANYQNGFFFQCDSFVQNFLKGSEAIMKLVSPVTSNHSGKASSVWITVGITTLN